MTAQEESQPLAPLATLFEAARGPLKEWPLTPGLAALYGRLAFPAHPGRPLVIGNFVTTLDGVVSLGIPGMSGGGPISGDSPHDRMLMGILRAVSDAVIVAAGTVRAVSPRHLWTADYIYPPLAPDYQALRQALGKEGPPLQVIVTGRGDLDAGLRVLGGEAPALIVTTHRGAAALKALSLPAAVRVLAVGDGELSVANILDAVASVRPCDVVLTEGGPSLMGDFFREERLDELFLTLAPQVAGRDASAARPGLVMGQLLAPDDPRWGRLASVKRAGSHLFLRYAF